MELRLDILPDEQLSIWKAFEASKLSGFTLYGGTALALRFGHRRSVDFDFFTGLPVTPDDVRHRLPWLDEHFDLTLQLEVNTFVFTCRAPGTTENGTVKLSIFGDLDLPVIEEPDVAPNGVSVASVKDLLATKLKFLNQRIEAKDYIDIIEILKRSPKAHEFLGEGLANMKAMFPEASPAETLKALCWFHGGDLDGLDAESRKFLETTVSKVGRLPVPSVRKGVDLKSARS